MVKVSEVRSRDNILLSVPSHHSIPLSLSFQITFVGYIGEALVAADGFSTFRVLKCD